MPVTVALQPYALTTLQRVLDELDLTSDGDKRDSILNGYINAASGWLRTKCSRTFQRANGIVEALAGYGMPRIRVSRPPIVTLTSVTINNGTFEDDAPVTVDDADLGWLYRELGFPWTASRAGGLDQEGLVGSEKKSISATYNGGFVTRPQNAVGGVGGDVTFVGAPITLPDEIEDAIIMLVTSRWLGRGRDRRVTAASFERSGYTFMGAAVPPEVASVVAQYALIAHA